MKKIVTLLISLLLVFSTAFAAPKAGCIEGDCKNGKGTWFNAFSGWTYGP